MPFQYQPRAFSIPNVALPPPVNILGSLADLANLAGYAQTMRQRRGEVEETEQRRARTKALEEALGQSRNDIDQAIGILEGRQQYPEAQLLREKKATIQKAQHDQVKAGYDAGIAKIDHDLKKLEHLGRLTAGIESDEAWQQDRPLLTQALGDEMVPQTYDKPWIDRTRRRGVDALQLMREQRQALDALDQLPTDRLTRDTKILDNLAPFVKGADTGEQLEEYLRNAEMLYSASPMVRKQIGQIPTGPLPQAWKTEALGRLSEPGAQAGTFEDYVTERFGANPTAPQTEQARRDWAQAGRDPDVGATERRQAKNAKIEQFRQDLSVAMTTEGADLVALQPTAKALGLRWTTEVALARRDAEQRRLATARDLQLLETVPRNPITGAPLEDPAAAQQRRLTAADSAVRSPAMPAGGPAGTTGPAPPAAATIRERVKEILRQQGFAETEANVDLFLSKPQNRELLGLPATLSPAAGQP